jgi:penicillin-binding protein 1A
MIFKSKRKKRVEPRLRDGQGADASGDIVISSDDRITPEAALRRAPARRKPAPARKRASSKSTSSRKKTSRASSPARRGRGLIGGAIYWSFIACIWGGVGIIGVLIYYGAQLPSASSWAVPDRPPNVKIVAGDGTMMANRGATGGEAVGLHEMSPYIPQALVAIEDRRYYSHFGIDPIGLTRAMTRNLAAGRLVQGGSTLTQQLAKNLFLSPERTIGRKVQEVLLAFWLENKYSKDQILEMYLNRVYFGSGAYGVEAAARRYFDKSARDVSLHEAALLAGLLKAPSRLSPARDPQAAEDRAQLVLGAMRAQGMVSDTEMTAALSRKTTRAAAYWDGSEHYVADAVMKELATIVGEVTTDLVVDTTVDLTLQARGEEAIRQMIAENGVDRKVSQGALVSIAPSGAIRALVGGHDYGDSQFDRATEARRQPGSAFKPFVYLAALERGMTPATTRMDAPIRIGKWSPENYGGTYLGEVTLETALSKSLNSVAVQLIMETGPRNVAETAQRLGISSKLKANASLALGTSEVTLLELTSAYVPFATGGWSPDPYLIRRVTTLDGKVIFEANPDRPRMMSADMAGMMNSMMAKTVQRGTATAAKFAHPAAGKTGTSQNSRDAWFVGYTSHLITGVWFGNDDGTPMNKVTGGSLPAKAWRSFMVAAHEDKPVTDLPGYMPFNVIPKERPHDLMIRRPSQPLVSGDPDISPPGPDDTTTASTAPRPRADVGARESERTVLDIILNR